MGQGAEANQVTWHRRCDSGACVEIAVRGDTVMVRSTVTPEMILTLTRVEWRNFLAGAKEGSFDGL